MDGTNIKFMNSVPQQRFAKPNQLFGRRDTVSIITVTSLLLNDVADHIAQCVCSLVMLSHLMLIYKIEAEKQVRIQNGEELSKEFSVNRHDIILCLSIRLHFALNKRVFALFDMRSHKSYLIHLG